MKANFFLYTFTCILLAFSSCKKEDPKPNSTTNASPVFTSSATINNVPVSLQAGVNNYYMFTSSALDANGVYDFTGELKDKNCSSGCANSLKISIKDYRKYSVMPTVIDSSILTGYYSFATPAGAPSQFNAVFGSSMQNATGQTWSWNFGDAGTYIANQPTATHQYFHPGVYNVSLNIVSTQTPSCSSSLTNELTFGQVGSTILNATYTASVSGNTVTCNSTLLGFPPYTYNWNFGDGGTSTSANPSYTYSSSGTYLVTLSASDANGHSKICNQNVSTVPSSVCATSYFLASTTPVSNPMNLADVIVEWRDANGTLWTSVDNNQNSTSRFEIVSVENYSNNTSGQPTKKIHALINCHLFNGSNNITFENADVIFSVAYH